MGKSTPPKPPATKKRKRAPPKKKKSVPPPPAELPLDLAEKLEKIQNHSNMVVEGINAYSKHMTKMSQHVQFLHTKLLEQTRIYNGEFRRLNNVIEHLEHQVRQQSCDNTPLPPLFDLDDELMFVEPMTVEGDVGLGSCDEHLMSEEELVQCISADGNQRANALRLPL